MLKIVQSPGAELGQLDQPLSPMAHDERCEGGWVKLIKVIRSESNDRLRKGVATQFEKCYSD